MKHFSLLLLISFFFAAPAFAQEVDCKNAMDQTSMNICAGQDYAAADDLLNKTYQELAATLSSEGLAKLKAAQRSWIAWRDAQCTFNTSATEGGNIHSMMVAYCMADLTEAQTHILDLQLFCPEGDLSCGGQ